MLLWFERANVELGIKNLRELDISIVPHVENADQLLRELRERYLAMIKPDKDE